MQMIRNKLTQGGVTLLELLVVVTIVGILATISYSAYRDSVVKSKRKAAAGCAIEAAQFMERFYTTNMTYAGAALPAMGCQADIAQDYAITVGGLSATGYTVSATPIAGQASSDTKCGTLTVNQRGTKTKSGTAALADCW